eukprot:m51a1_g11222 hypothetical protein (190) ;mRNA; f:1480-12882
MNLRFKWDTVHLAKAEAYIKLHKLFMINDVLKQHILLNRQLVYKVLQDNGIAVPPYEVFVNIPVIKPYADEIASLKAELSLVRQQLADMKATALEDQRKLNAELVAVVERTRDAQKGLEEHFITALEVLSAKATAAFADLNKVFTATQGSTDAHMDRIIKMAQEHEKNLVAVVVAIRGGAAPVRTPGDA